MSIQRPSTTHMLFLSLFIIQIPIHRQSLVPMSSQSPWGTHTTIHNRFGTLISILRQYKCRSKTHAWHKFRLGSCKTLSWEECQFKYVLSTNINLTSMLGTNVNPKPIHDTSVLGLAKNIYQTSIYQRVSQNTDRSPKSTPGTHVISVTIQDTNIPQYYQGIYVNTELKHVRNFNPKLVRKTSLSNILNYVKDTYHPLEYVR